jgi:hypothetical protein
MQISVAICSIDIAEKEHAIHRSVKDEGILLSHLLRIVCLSPIFDNSLMFEDY